jgi:hypothetical protein
MVRFSRNHQPLGEEDFDAAADSLRAIFLKAFPDDPFFTLIKHSEARAAQKKSQPPKS